MPQGLVLESLPWNVVSGNEVISFSVDLDVAVRAKQFEDVEV